MAANFISEMFKNLVSTTVTITITQTKSVKVRNYEPFHSLVLMVQTLVRFKIQPLLNYNKLTVNLKLTHTCCYITIGTYNIR